MNNNTNDMIKLKKYIKLAVSIILVLAIMNYQNIYDSMVAKFYDVNSINLSESCSFAILVINGDNRSDLVKIEDEEQTKELIELMNSLILIKKSPCINIDHNKYAYIYLNDKNIDVIGVTGNYIKIWLKGGDDTNFTTYYILNSDYNVITGTNRIYKYLKELIS